MSILIKNCTIIDGTGAEPAQSQSIRIEGNTIIWIGNSNELPQENQTADEIIELDNAVVMPGMIDTHVHISQGYEIDQSGFLADTIPFLTIRAISSCKNILESGFTSVRNMGTYG